MYSDLPGTYIRRDLGRNSETERSFRPSERRSGAKTTGLPGLGANFCPEVPHFIYNEALEFIWLKWRSEWPRESEKSGRNNVSF